MTYLVALALGALGGGIWLATRALVLELRAWRRVVVPQLVALPRPTDFTVHHRVHDDTIREARKLVRVATIGAEAPQPAKRAQGSPDPEALAQKRAAEDSIARIGLRIQAMYAESGQTADLDRCLLEARAMLNGVDPFG